MVGKNEGGSGGEKSLDLFLKIGLDERTAKNTVANNKVTANLTAVIHEAAVTDGCDRTVGNLLLKLLLSWKLPFHFLRSASDNFKADDFEAACGVGVEVSLDDIEHAVDEIFEENKAVIVEQRSGIWMSQLRQSRTLKNRKENVGELFGYVRKKQPWADPKIVKQIIDTKLYALLGERTAADNEKPTKKKKRSLSKLRIKLLLKRQLQQNHLKKKSIHFQYFLHQSRTLRCILKYISVIDPVLRACNSKEILDKHLKVTGGKVFTRFPPEPNGYLHIGYVCGLWPGERAGWMLLSEGLTYDDIASCNLDKFHSYTMIRTGSEKKEYIDHIEEIVGWMGWEPFKITYSSDYFQELYELAVERYGEGMLMLITRNLVAFRRRVCAEQLLFLDFTHWTALFLEFLEFLEIFADFKHGLIEEGKATLRMKQDMQSDNFNMYDLIAYRIKFTPHPHAGDKWCIYPSYDYAHCIVDSLENITHSSKYFMLGMCDSSLIRLERLEYHIREELNKTAPRTMVVLNPIKVVITNMEASVMDLDAKKWPDAPADDASSFYKVCLYAFPIKCTEVILGDDNETILEIHAEYDPSKKSKPKGVLHWVSESSLGVEPLKVEVRLFEKLFISENPAELDDWLGDLNPHSKEVITDAYAVPSLKNAAIGDTFQFERLGYFVVDKDSSAEKLVFNRTVTLRDSYGKGGSEVERRMMGRSG
ncbi:hypothetical protein DH2020_011939 [Rehmannia glutinosa]|uniref:glutamine--tRNA ligase n=1 Tax=Rehmannia glutinosa TaxID=99300 RepID=A0ABR0XEY4_REHGL